jgi:secreted trypsin-like serine protease
MRHLIPFILILGLLLPGCKGSSKVSANFNGGTTGGSVTAKIINGVEVDTVASPQIVAVNMYGADGSLSLCSATSIAPEYFLSAAHCFPDGTLATSVTIAGQEYFAKSVTRHPDFFESAEVSAFFNDVAVVHVPGVNVPALAILASQPVPENSTVFTYGYGLDENGNAGVLKNGPVQILFSTENHLFSSVFDGSNVDPCNGDSGGPAVLGFTDVNGVFAVGITGIVSSGTVVGCEKGDTTLFTNLQNPGVSEFIRAQVPGVVFN